MRRTQLDEFMRRMEPGSVAILPGAQEATRSNDTHFRFRQNSDFYYLTGFDEPEALAVLAPAHPAHPYTLFVRPRDPEREIWDGRRAGVEGAREQYGADAAYPSAELSEKLGDLLNGARLLYYRLGVEEELDRLVLRQLERLRSGARRGTSAPDTITDPSTLLHEMRLVKSEEELELMQQAADISAEAHREAMKHARPGMKEYEIEALVEYVFRRNGASAPAYTTIVGSGPNATILHYIDNDATLLEGELLLIDAGAEFGGYAADITRTFPINGRFTAPQRELYSLVLKAQEACIEMVRPGATLEELHGRSVELLTEGMLSLGLLAGDAAKLIEDGAYKRFYMHRLGHYLGMDVHDVGLSHVNGKPRPVAAGMVMTVEPGIYIAADAEDVPEKYRGLGVRIEDDVLVTATGGRVLTADAPKQVEEIEQLMARR